jgi:hypothetical protein
MYFGRFEGCIRDEDLLLDDLCIDLLLQRLQLEEQAVRRQQVIQLSMLVG